MEFVRGDTFYISRCLTDKNDNPLILNKETDDITLTVRESIDSEIIIEKHIEDFEITEDGIYRVVLNPKDTETLELGIYEYDIEIRIGKNEENPFVRTPETGTIRLLSWDFSRPKEVI